MGPARRARDGRDDDRADRRHRRRSSPRSPGADVVVAMRERTRFDAERLDALPGLRLLVTTGMGNAAIDLDAARRNGVVVCGTRGRARHTVELTWALILALVRSVPAEDARIRAGGWQHTFGTELDGATLGLVGLGRLGSAMVPVARAFGMDVIAWSQNLDAGRTPPTPGPQAVAKDELFRARRRREHPLQAVASAARDRRRRGDRGDEADGVPRQHVARAAGRHRRAAPRAGGRGDRRRRARRLRPRAARRRTTRCAAHRARSSRRTSAT